MTKGDARKWGKAVEGVTGGDKVSQNVCKGTTSGDTKKCGTNDSTATTKISDAFAAGSADTLLSAEGNKDTINLQGMANNINGLDKEGKAVVAGA